MPHKKSRYFELIRGKCNILQGFPTELTLLTNNLPSGYHREMQLTKEVLFPAINTVKDCLCHRIYLKSHSSKDNILEMKSINTFSVENVMIWF